MTAPFTQRLRRVVRAGIVRRGYAPFVLALLALGLFAIPPSGEWSSIVTRGIGAVGLAGLIYGSGIIKGIGEKAKTLFAWYATLSRHGAKLGLQALIGDDLRALLIAWIPSPRPDTTDIPGERKAAKDYSSWWNLAPTGTALIVFIAIWIWCMRTQAGAPTVYILIFVAWGVVCIAALAAALVPSSGTDRVLLVVDDLDRCSPSEVIDIAESLKLLLEDDDMKDRVQVLMLVDEEVLDHAIARKFAALIDERADADDGADANAGAFGLACEARKAIVSEHVEKLFLCYLRLPPLNQHDVTVMVECLTSRMKTDAGAPIKSPFSEVRTDEVSDAPPASGPKSPVTEPPVAIQSFPLPPRRLVSGSKLRFTDDEIKILQEKTGRLPQEKRQKSQPPVDPNLSLQVSALPIVAAALEVQGDGRGRRRCPCHLGCVFRYLAKCRRGRYRKRSRAQGIAARHFPGDLSFHRSAAASSLAFASTHCVPSARSSCFQNGAWTFR